MIGAFASLNNIKTQGERIFDSTELYGLIGIVVTVAAFGVTVTVMGKK